MKKKDALFFLDEFLPRFIFLCSLVSFQFLRKKMILFFPLFSNSLDSFSLFVFCFYLLFNCVVLELKQLGVELERMKIEQI